jgi:hypothetical protein
MRAVDCEGPGGEGVAAAAGGTEATGGGGIGDGSDGGI